MRIRRTGLRDQVEARCALEVEAARLAALRHTPEVVADLRQLLADRGEYATARHDYYVEHDLAFHKAVVAASCNLALIEVYEFFSVSTQEIIRATVTGELPEPDMAAHAAIIDAIESGDPDKAASTARAFMAPLIGDAVAARTNLADTAIDNIRAEIVSNRWPVGDRIPNEAALADMLGVSRGTVREAVRVLVAQGFLETKQGSGNER